MGYFLELFIAEVMARRRRIASTVGPLAQGLFDLALLGGVVIGSAGLLIYPWMPSAAPWGFAIPVVYLVGHLLLDARRQAALEPIDRSAREAAKGAENQRIILIEVREMLDHERKEEAAPRDAAEAAEADRIDRIIFEGAKEKHDSKMQDLSLRLASIDEARARVRGRADLFAVLFSLACAALGAATFAYALSQEPEPPPPPPAEEWTPPDEVIDLDITR